MNSTKQLWALLKFQIMANPFVFILVLTFTMHIYLDFLHPIPNYHPSLDRLLSNYNLFFVGFLGVVLLAPELMQSSASNTGWSSGTEFLLTRAIDRHLLWRARVVLFYLLVLIIPLVVFLVALRNPSLQLDEYNKTSHQQILEKIPESVPLQFNGNVSETDIIIPHGNLLVTSWRIWVFSFVAIITQTIVILVYSMKYRRYILWGIYAAFMAYLFLSIGHHSLLNDVLSNDEILFFYYVSELPLFWIFTVAALVFGQLWSENRFDTCDQ